MKAPDVPASSVMAEGSARLVQLPPLQMCVRQACAQLPNQLFLFYVCRCLVYMYVSAHIYAWYPQSPEEGVEFPQNWNYR